MNLNNLREQLRSELIVLGLGGRIASESPLPDIDLSLSTPCFQAFFKLVDRLDELEPIWRNVQESIARYKAQQKLLPRDLYLTLLLLDSVGPSDLGLLRSIAADPMVCRKLVLLAKPETFATAIESLPFIRLGLGAARPAPGIQEVFAAFEGRGYPRALLEMFGERVGTDRLLTQILDLQIPPEIPQVELGQPLVVEQRVKNDLCRTERLVVTNFRGLRLADIDISSSITVIYGANGTGKTSFCDALEWALLGGVERLDASCTDDTSGRSPYLNLFAEEQATVIVNLRIGKTAFNVRRILNAAHESSVSINGRSTDDREVLTTITGQEAGKLDTRVLRRLVRATSFLSQSTLQQFLSDDPRQRYWSLSHLLGTNDYMRVLEKLDDLRKEIDKRVDATEDVIESANAESGDLTKQIKGRELLLSGSPETRDLDQRLSELVEQTRGRLSDVNSPYSTLFASPQDFREVQSSISVATDWADKEYKQGKIALQQIAAAMEASKRRIDILNAIGEMSAAMATTQNKLQTERGELAQKKAERANKESELGALSSAVENLKNRQSRLQEGLIVLHQMSGLRKLIVEQQEQLATLDSELLGDSQKRGQLVEDLKSATNAREQAAPAIAQARQQLRLLDAAESLAASFSQIVLERPALSNQLRSLLESMRNQQSTKADLSIRLAELRQQLAASSAERESQLQTLERFQALVAELREFIATSECPLCGHDWATIEKLKEAVTKRTVWVLPRVRKLDEEIAQIQQHIVVTDAGHRYSEQEIARLSAVRSETERRVQQIGESETRLRELLKQAGVAVDSGAAQPDIHRIREQMGSRLSNMTTDAAALETRILRLRDDLALTEAESLRKQEARQRVSSRLADTQKRLNNLATQLSLLDIDPESDQRGIETTAEALKGEIESLDHKRTALLQECSLLDSAVQEAELSMGSTVRTSQDQATSLSELQGLLKRTDETLFEAHLQAESKASDIEPLTREHELRLMQLDRARTCLRELQQLSSWTIARYEIKQLTEKLAEVSARIQGLASDSKRRSDWHTHLSGLHVAILDIKATVENLQLEKYGPTINVLYQRLNTHPLFTDLKVLVDAAAQSVQINVSLSPSLNMSSTNTGLAPVRYLSEAQLNIVALSIFLSHSYQQTWSRFTPLFLDDPVQNLDDFNANGLIDCVRSLAEDDRQFVLSTSNLAFYRLLLVKLRCMNYDNSVRFRAYRLEGISDAGPKIIQDFPATHNASPPSPSESVVH